MATVFWDASEILDYMLYARKTYGPIWVGYLGLKVVLIILEPEMVEKVWTSEHMVDKADLYHVVSYVFGDGLFSSKKKKWSHNRKLINPSFSHKILVSFFPVFNKQIKIFNKKMESRTGQEIDIFEEIERCTIDTACVTTMGKELNFQSDQNKKLLHTFYDTIVVMTERVFVPWYQNSFLFKLMSLKKSHDQDIADMKTFVSGLIKDKLNQNEPEESTHNKEANDDFHITKSKKYFLDQVIQLLKTGELTWEDVQNESNTMVIAAFETSANVLYITMMCLAMFPEYQDRVFDEILSVFLEKDFEVNYDDLQNLPYTEMVINEAMRVFAPVPLVARRCNKDVVLDNGVFIAEGTQVAVDIFTMQRDESLWGSDAKTFNPDHFLKDNFIKKHPYSFVPFTKGIRNCIGWRYGLMSVKVMLVQILRKYSVSTSFKFEDLQFVEDITLKFVKYPKIKFELRDL